MRRIAKVWLTVSVALLCCGGITIHAYGDWSEAVQQANNSSQDPVVNWSFSWRYIAWFAAFPQFTTAQLFIVENASTGVTFQEPTSIAGGSKVLANTDWQSTIVNPQYSLLTGNIAEPLLSPLSYLTTFFSGPSNANFELDMVLWNGDTVVRREAFYFKEIQVPVYNITLYNQYTGTEVLSSTPGNYNQSIPIPFTILLFGPGALGVLLFRKRIGAY